VAVTQKQGLDIILTEREYVPTIIQTQLLNDIAGILYEQLAVMKDAIPDMFEKYEYAVTNTITELTSETLSSFPWISVTIYNVGADPVHIFINEFNGEVSGAGAIVDPALPSGDTFTIDMRSPKIKKVFLVCDVGKTATVRLFVTCKNYREHEREEVVL
jgi:hypothetical protein